MQKLGESGKYLLMVKEKPILICSRPIYDSYNYIYYSAWNDRTHSYKTAKFDIVVGQEAAQAKVFELAGMYNIVKHVAEGYHATVFAYG
jgi:hypothetical protein